MTDRIRFHLDENIDLDVARGLRRYGIDVTTTQEIGLRTTQDHAHLDFARGEARMIVTHDADFLRYAHERDDHPGVAYCAMGARSVGEILRSLILIYEVCAPADVAGRVEYI